MAAALLVRRALEDPGLAGAVKTSGSKGVHVVVPVRGSGPEDVAAATRALAGRARAGPDLATTAYIKDDRHGRVFLDSTRSGSAPSRPRTARGSAGPAGLLAGRLGRARDRASRSADGHGRRRRLDGDPWAAALPARQELPAALVAEGHTIPVARVAAMHEGKRRKRAARTDEG